MEDLTKRRVMISMFVLWAILFLPWFPLALLSGMAFDAGYNARAYTFFWSVWTYPISVAVAFFCRRKVPFLALLPVLNVAGIVMN